jgi:hypothetical protein
MAGTPRYSISQEVPPAVRLPVMVQPARTSQLVPAAVPLPVAPPIWRPGVQAVQAVPEATPLPTTYRISQPVPEAIPYNAARDPAKQPTAGSIVTQAADALRTMYPGLNDARVRSTNAIQDNVNKGQYARAAGRAILGAGDMVGGFVGDLEGADRSLEGGIKSFLGGLIGSSGTTTDAAKPAGKAVAKVATPSNPVSKALAQGAVAEPVISTGDDIHKFISARLKQGVTNHDIVTLAGIAATVPALTKSAQSNKDKILGQAGEVTDQVFANEAAQAEDAARIRLGATADISKDPEYRKAALAAAERYRINLATLSGSSPQGLALQQQLGQQDDQ